MFARFRNLFSKNKTESEAEANGSSGSYSKDTESSAGITVSSEVSSKLEGFDFLKSLVESEQQSRSQTEAENESSFPNSLSEEVADLLKKRLLRNEENSKSKEEKISDECFENKIAEHSNAQNIKTEKKNCQGYEDPQSESKALFNKPNLELTNHENILVSLLHKEQPEILKTEKKTIQRTRFINSSETGFIKQPSQANIIYKENMTSSTDNKNPVETETKAPPTSENVYELDTHSENYSIHSSNIETVLDNSRENSPGTSESSNSLSQSSVKEKSVHSTTEFLKQNLSETNRFNNSSIVAEDLPSEITTPSPTVESTISGCSSNTSILESPAIDENLDSSKIIINPINKNGLACNAITNKLSDIAEVAESLDAVIRDVQENFQFFEVESNPSPSHKKTGTLRSTSSEDWHSRSTEDDSFATASEGNFTPSSSSFHTASGRTSSYISCDKNSFDAGEADDSTFAFEMPEIASPLNMSFEGSEQSYLSTQTLNNNLTVQDEQKVPTTKLKKTDSCAVKSQEDDLTSTADVEELHSESATPTPEEHYDSNHMESIPIESETEFEVDGITNTPSMEILTEHTTLPMSRTPEVSPSNSNTSSNRNPIITQLTANLVRNSNEQQEQQNSNTNNNNIKPNAAWRHSKYYENITKQTIKGFL